MDDVQYLLKSAKEESYLFVVDSRMRDTEVYPTPSDYEIEFASPFRNVFGLDVIDASIARTEYIVDTNTATLDYAMGTPTALTGDSTAWNLGAWVTASPTPRRTVTLTPGDYNLPQFIKHLNDVLADAAATHNEAPIKAAALTNPAELSNRIVFTCQSPFTFLMGTSTLRHTLGFGDPVRAAETTEYRAVPGWSVSRTGGASSVFVCKTAQATPDADPQPATLGPIPAGPDVQTDQVYGSRVLRQYFASATAGPVTQVLAYVLRKAGGPTLALKVARVSDDAVMATGTLAPSIEDPNASYTAVSVTMTPAAVLVSGTAYYLEVTAVGGGGTASEYTAVFYNADNLPTSASRYATLDGVTVHAGQQLCCDVVCSSYGYALTTPGLVNLTGPRYVNIRCPDIESYMYRDRVNETVHVGLGMVKLAGYGFREQRFDFVSFPPRRFHPIGRLTKLRFRLERPDGSLYDSHGVDHTLLLVVKYYSLPASGGADEGASTRLNPEYVPDLRRYMVERRWPDEVRANTDRASKFY